MASAVTLRCLVGTPAEVPKKVSFSIDALFYLNPYLL